MKRYLSALLTAAAVVISLQIFAGNSLAQGRSCDRNNAGGRYGRNVESRNYNSGYEQRRYEQAAATYGNRGYNTGYYDPYYNSGSSGAYYDPYYDPYYNGNGNYGTSTYDRHRKAVNIGVGAAAGGAVGAAVGGSRGLVIGATAGAIGGAIVTAVQSPRNYPRY